VPAVLVAGPELTVSFIAAEAAIANTHIASGHGWIGEVELARLDCCFASIKTLLIYLWKGNKNT